MSITICIRCSIDWNDEAAVAQQIQDEFRPKMEMWNATFTIPYHRFRQRIKEIAQRNLAQINGAEIMPLEKTPADAIVVPVDDDDWFSPDLATILRQADTPDIRGFYWIHNTIELPRPINSIRRIFENRQRRTLGVNAPTAATTCSSNNYALRKIGDIAVPVASHLEASRVFDADRSAIRFLPLSLCIQNRNITSQTVLGWGRPTIERHELVRIYHRYQRLYSRIRLTPVMGWAAPSIAQSAELMKELKVR